MAKRSGGFPGMGGNMNQLMKQAQKMQKQRGHRHTDMCRDGEKRPYARLQQKVF